MPSTTVLNSAFVTSQKWYTTGKYARRLNVTKTNGGNPNIFIADPAFPLSGTTQTVNAVAFAGNKTLTSTGFYSGTTTSYQGTYLSDNTASGVSYFVFNKNTYVDGVDLNVGPNSTGVADGSDSVFIATRSSSMSMTNDTITTGDSTSTKGDLIAFGTSTSTDGVSYTARSASSGAVFSATFGAFNGPGSGSLTVNRVTVNTGDGSDTVLFANATGAIGSNTSGRVNSFNLGKGADLFFVNTPSTVFGQNVIDLGADSSSDSIVFGAGSFSNTNLTGVGVSALTVKNFTDNTDRFVYRNTVYNTKAAVEGVLNTGGLTRIYFT